MDSKQQRRGKEIQGHQSKRWKFDETSNDAIKSINITDINDDCLAQVFAYLKFVDIVNVADVSRRFKNVTERLSKTRCKLIRIELNDPKARSRNQLIDECGHFTIIYSLPICFKVLRCFGHTVEIMDINYSHIAQNPCAEVDRYINEYCADALTFIRLYNAKPYSMNKLKDAFSRVLIVELYNSELDPQVLSKFFPLAFSLSYYGVNKVTSGEHLANNIPRLKNLSVELLTKNEDSNVIGKNEIAKMLRVNPKIRNLTISGPGWDAKNLRDISEDLENVRYLKLHVCRDFFNLETETIHLNNIESLEIVNYSKDEFPRVSLSFGHLKTLTISTSNKVNDNFIKFVSQLKSLKKLNLTWYGSENKNVIKDILINDGKLQEVLYSLEYLRLDFDYSTNEIIQFLKKFKMLKCFTIKLDVNSKLDSLKERLPAEWRDFKNYGNEITLSYQRERS